MVRPPRPQPQDPLVRAKVEVGSAGDLAEHTLSVCFEEALNRPGRCRLLLDDWGPDGFRFSETPAVDFAVPLALELSGASGNLEPVFQGRIYALGRRLEWQQTPTLALEAFDPLQSLAMTRRSRHFEELPIADILGQVAADHGLTASVDLDAAVPGSVVQANESDLDFVVRLLAAEDAELWVEGSVLHVARHTQRPGATLELRSERDLFDLSIDATLAGQRERLSVHGWDMRAKEAVVASADPTDLADELDGGLSGGALLGHAAAEAAEEHLVHRLADGQVSAGALASARYARLSRRFVTLRATARGQAGLRVGTKIDLVGAGLRFDGRYVIAAVSHRVDPDEGYRCDIEARRSGVER